MVELCGFIIQKPSVLGCLYICRRALYAKEFFMKKNNFFLLAVVVLFSSMEITSCLSLSSIASNNPIQIGRFAFGLTVNDKDQNKDIALSRFYGKFGNDPDILIPILNDFMKKNYHLYVEAAAKEGIKLDVERFENEFLNPENHSNFEISLGPLFEFTVDPQDPIYASLQMSFAMDLNPRSRTYGELIFPLDSPNLFTPSNANLVFVRGTALSKIIYIK
jgi:hypothetical protein